MKLILTILAIIYVLSPYDLVPDFAFGLGWLDDLVVLWLLWRFFYATRRILFGKQNVNQRPNLRHVHRAPCEQRDGHSQCLELEILRAAIRGGTRRRPQGLAIGD